MQILIAWVLCADLHAHVHIIKITRHNNTTVWHECIIAHWYPYIIYIGYTTRVTANTKLFQVEQTATAAAHSVPFLGVFLVPLFSCDWTSSSRRSKSWRFSCWSCSFDFPGKFFFAATTTLKNIDKVHVRRSYKKLTMLEHLTLNCGKCLSFGMSIMRTDLATLCNVDETRSCRPVATHAINRGLSHLDTQNIQRLNGIWSRLWDHNIRD